MLKAFKFFGVLGFITCLISCDKNENPQPVTKPALTSFFPVKSTQNDPVRIVGKNLTNVTSVDFGGVAATSFTIESDSVIMAVVGNAVSGKITVRTANAEAQIGGYIFYQPQIYKLYGTTKYSFTYAVPISLGGGTKTDTALGNDTASFAVLELNKYDSRNARSYFSAYNEYATQPGYVRLVGIVDDNNSTIVGGQPFFKFSPDQPFNGFVVYAKLTSTGFEIPKQNLDFYIEGNAVLVNGKYTLSYKTEYRGRVKEAVVSEK
jgi:hypothetical protein